MAGETLSPSPVGRDRTFPDLLELFAASMLRCRVPNVPSRAVAARARDHARTQVAQARSPLGSQQVLALRAVYDEARALGSEPALEATGESLLPPTTRSGRAYEAMLHLRHRQRAAVVLHDLGALPTAMIADVLGMPKAKVISVVEAARSGMLARLKEPMNVRHALRDAGRDLIVLDEPDHQAPVLRPALEPRAVVSNLIGPAIDAPSLFPEAGLRAQAALRALEDAPADITFASTPAAAPTPAHVATPADAPTRPILRAPLMQPKSRSRRVRVILVAACAVLAAVVVPAAGRSPQIPPTAPRVSATTTTPVVDPTREISAASPVPPRTRTVSVARGDSLWALAERHLGDGYRWPEIWRLNRGVAMRSGRFTHPSVIEPGWRLELPRR